MRYVPVCCGGLEFEHDLVGALEHVQTLAHAAREKGRFDGCAQSYIWVSIMYIHIYMYINVYIYTHVYIHIHMYVYTYVYRYESYVHIYVYTCTNICIQYIFMYVYTHIWIDT